MMKDLYRETVHKMCRANLMHRYRITTALSGFNIYRGQPELLGFLLENGECSQKTIAESMGVSAASVATSIKRLCKAGFVERTEDENDRRINRICITQKGKDVFEAGKQECDKVDACMFSGISDEEVEKFGEILAKIAKNLSIDGLSDREVLNYIAKQNGREGDDKNA